MDMAVSGTSFPLLLGDVGRSIAARNEDRNDAFLDRRRRRRLPLFFLPMGHCRKVFYKKILTLHEFPLFEMCRTTSRDLRKEMCLGIRTLTDAHFDHEHLS